MKPTRILLVEDDPSLAELLMSDLTSEGYDVKHVADGEVALEMAESWRPALMILDVMLPKKSGYDVCRHLRQRRFTGAIIMLTARSQEAEKILGLEMGADDYVTKPFSGLELLARIKARLRRHGEGESAPAVLEFDDVRVDFRRCEVTRGKKKIALTPKEFALLEMLAQHQGEVVNRDDFLREIWNHEEIPTTRTVDTQIMTLRKKLGDGEGKRPHRILTVHGVGYKFLVD